jgi:hypothetical protein
VRKEKAFAAKHSSVRKRTVESELPRRRVIREQSSGRVTHVCILPTRKYRIRWWFLRKIFSVKTNGPPQKMCTASYIWVFPSCYMSVYGSQSDCVRSTVFFTTSEYHGRSLPCVTSTNVQKNVPHGNSATRDNHFSSLTSLQFTCPICPTSAPLLFHLLSMRHMGNSQRT